MKKSISYREDSAHNALLSEILGADYMSRVSRLAELTRLSELTVKLRLHVLGQPG